MKRALSGSDRWAALGDRRRAYPTPSKTPDQTLTTPRKRSRAGSWRARNIDAKAFKSPISFVNDPPSTSGVLDQYERHFSAAATGPRSGRAFTTMAASKVAPPHISHEHQTQLPWLMSKDWRQHGLTTPQREKKAGGDLLLSGWRRELHL
jgi:hypothetical protein